LFLRISLKDDRDAFQALFYEFFSALCVFAHRYIDDWMVCEDLVQEVFYKIWKNRKTIDIDVSSRNFLVTCVRNACIDHLRKQSSARIWRATEKEAATGLVPGDLYTRTELESILTAALSKLPDNIREVFEMNRFDGKTYREIADEKKISVKTVEAHITKALRVLRTEFRDYLPLLTLMIL